MIRLPLLCFALSACTLTRDWDDLGPHEPGPDVPTSFNTALRFSGACAGASAELSRLVDFGAGEPFTFELWYQIDRFEQFNLPIHKGGSSLEYPGWDMEVNEAGSLGFFTSGEGRMTVAASAQPVVVDHAYHIAAMRDGAHAELWLLDASAGEKLHRIMGSVNDVPSTWTSRSNLVVGGSSTDVGNCVDYASAKGILDEVRIWNVVRSPIDLDRDYDQPIACDTPGLVAYYRFDEGSGTVVADCGANAIHLDIVGGSAPTEYEWLASPFDP